MYKSKSQTTGLFMSKKNKRRMVKSLFIFFVAGINLMLGVIFVYAIQDEINFFLLMLIIPTVLMEVAIIKSAINAEKYDN